MNGFGKGLRRLRSVVVTSVVVLAAVVAVPAATATAAEPAVRDGSTSALAAGSCWQIKQTVPASADGVYWLQTPQLIAPQQFYCDMTTDGGGWVLVGRGRDGWTWADNGQGTAGALRGTVSGPDAFAPAALPAATVDALLGGTRLDALAEGIRVRRATDRAGTDWQEMRLRPQARATWSWSFGGGIRTSGVTVNGTNYPGGNTQSWAAGGDQGLLRLGTTDLPAHNYRRGFGYGTQIGGLNNATSHLWEYTTENQALPFTQVFLRPRTGNAGYTPVADTGTPAETVRPLLGTTTSTATPWGVNGVVGGGSGELNMEVEDFAFIGSTVYVGGKFEFVQRGATPAPADRVRQPYLAAFDLNTGEWRPDFRPVLDGMVWSLAAADGKLIVGGEFTGVNGVAGTSSLAALDPTTGAPVAGWRAPVTHEGDNTPNVRGLDVQDGWIYVGGRFNRIAGGNRTVPLQLSGAARVRVSDGEPDPTWKPHFDGTIFELDASDRGDRVYYAGRFNNANFTPSPMFAVVSTRADAPLVGGLQPWVPAAGSGQNTYQQTVLEVGESLWLGGSQHILSRYDRDDMNFLNGNITRNGGDFQALAVVDGVVYGACHCIHYNYSGTTDWQGAAGKASGVDNIRFIGAWDAATGEYLPEFFVSGLDGRNDMGPWAMREDPNGCLWFGGDFTRGSWQGSGYQWLGGFGKLCPRDTSAPSSPTNLTAAVTAGGVSLSWGASTDPSGVQYEVLRDDRVVATVGGRTHVDAGAPLPARYWVRAIDGQGNRSASTAVAAVAAPPDTTPPSVALTSPAGGATVSGNVPVTVQASDGVGVTSVQLVVDGAAVGAPDTAAPYEFVWPAGAAGDHVLSARAVDAAGNTADAAGVTVRVVVDAAAPSAVTGLTVTATSASSVSLRWNAARDDRGVGGYVVRRNDTALGGTPAQLRRTDSALQPATTYTYTVAAVDTAGNVGPASAAVTATTGGEPAAVFRDGWSGAEGAPWSAPWSSRARAGSVITTGGAGALSVAGAAGAFGRAWLGTAPQADADLLLSYRWTDPRAAAFLNVYVRGSGGWQDGDRPRDGHRPRNGYGVQIVSSSPTVRVLRNVDGRTTSLVEAADAQVVTSAKQWLRLRVVGSTVRFRIWQDGQAEPRTWTTTLTDTAVTAPGLLHVSLDLGPANSGPKSVLIDDLVLRRVEQ